MHRTALRLCTLSGVVSQWHFVDRHGVIDVAGPDGVRQFAIRHARAFETLMPTQHRSLEGAHVRFTPTEDGAAEGIFIDLDTVAAKDTRSTPPPLGIRDMRNEALPAPRADPAEGRTAAITGTNARVAYPTLVQGRVVAWSALHRTGVVAASLEDGAAEAHFAVSSVRDFESAMPSSLTLVGATVRFRPVHVHPITNLQELSAGASAVPALGPLLHSVATEIFVLELPPAPEKPAAPVEEKPKRAAAYFEEGDAAEDDGGEPEEGRLFGVVTRWSGGQGMVEGSSGRKYFVVDAQAFSTFTSGTVAVRGAVVEFDRADAAYAAAADERVGTGRGRRYAVGIRVLSDLSAAGAGVAQVIPMQTALLSEHDARASWRTPATPQVPQSRPVEASAGDAAAASRLDELPLLEGTVATFSAAEGQGVIKSADGTRFLLRNAETDVLEYADAKGRLEHGARVSFVAVGASGKLAARVRLLQVADGRTVEEAEEEERAVEAAYAEDGGVDTLTVEQQEAMAKKRHKEVQEEATAGPTSTAYWMSRFEKVGADMSEYRKHKEQLAPTAPEEDDEEDPLAKDAWFSDPSKNKKVRGDARISDVMKLHPAGIMDLGMKARDPERLYKENQRLKKRLPEDVQEYCFAQAKEQAPRFLKEMQRARNKGQEPVFHFQS